MPVPIVVFCYNRPVHLEKTVESILRNKISEDSTIFFFSDGPKDSHDISSVNSVREYLNKVSGFREIILEFSPENKGLANSVIAGVSKVFQNYDAAIILEDDILVSTDFLDFMNLMLKTHQFNMSIYSISGYSFLLENCAQARELNMVRRASSWGWATWKDRWETVNWENEALKSILKSSELISLLRFAGSDLPVMVKKQILGVINSWAIRWTCHHLINNAYCLVPKYSKIQNIGTDGSGTNFKSSFSKYDSSINENSINGDGELSENESVNDFIKNKFRPSLARTIKNFIKYGV